MQIERSFKSEDIFEKIKTRKKFVYYNNLDNSTSNWFKLVRVNSLILAFKFGPIELLVMFISCIVWVERDKITRYNFMIAMHPPKASLRYQKWLDLFGRRYHCNAVRQTWVFSNEFKMRGRNTRSNRRVLFLTNQTSHSDMNMN